MCVLAKYVISSESEQPEEKSHITLSLYRQTVLEGANAHQ